MKINCGAQELKGWR